MNGTSFSVPFSPTPSLEPGSSTPQSSTHTAGSGGGKQSLRPEALRRCHPAPCGDRVIGKETDISGPPNASPLPPAAPAGGKLCLVGTGLGFERACVAVCSLPLLEGLFTWTLLHSCIFLACVWYFNPIILSWQKGPRDGP